MLALELHDQLSSDSYMNFPLLSSRQSKVRHGKLGNAYPSAQHLAFRGSDLWLLFLDFAVLTVKNASINREQNPKILPFLFFFFLNFFKIQ